jgi:hypothetical protein
MFQKTMIAAAVLAIATPIMAHAGDKTEAGAYDMWASVEDGKASYAVVNRESGKSTVAKITDGKGKVLDGAEAETALEEMKSGEHGKNIAIFKSRDGKDVDIIADKVKVLKEGSSAEDITIITMGDSDEDIEIKIDAEFDTDIDVEKMLSDSGIADVITKDGKRKIIITELDAGEEGEHVIEEVTEDVTEEDGNTEKKVIKKKIKIVRATDAPTPPQPPATPETDDVEDVKVVVKNSSKSVFKFKSDDDGEEKTFIRISGATEKDAREFINDIDDLSRRQKRKMREALAI